MRLHFVSRLTLLLIGGVLVVATQENAWSHTTLQACFVLGGVIAIIAAATGAHVDGVMRLPSNRRRRFDLVTVALGAWMIVEVVTLAPGELRWWTLGSACALTALGVLGLAEYEWSTERVVYELRITQLDESDYEDDPHRAFGEFDY